MRIVGGQETKNLRRVRAAIFASGSGTNFEAIVDANRADKINLDIIVLVYNERDAEVQNRAAALGIESVFLSHRNYPSRVAFDLALATRLEDLEIDIIILAGWMRLLSPEFLLIYPEVLNIHPSILPAFPGLNAIEKAHKAGVQESGCTVHQVISEMDAGPIVAQAFVKTASLSLDEMKKRIQEAEHVLYPRAIALYLDNTSRFSENTD